MALPRRVVGGLRPSLAITWEREDGDPEDLTGATMTGTILHELTGSSRAIAGTLTVTDGAAGEFVWAFAAADLATPGTFVVQFIAAFAAPPTPAKSFATELIVV